MKKSDITKIIREEVINIIRDQYLTEAFADPNIRKISKMRGIGDRRWSNFFTKFAHTHDIAWDKLPKGTLNKVSGPEQAKKGLAFWVIKGRKANPFVTGGRYSWDRDLGTPNQPSVVAVTLDNKIQYFSGKGVGAKQQGYRASTASDAVGLGVRGTLMVKKLKELADEIYVMDFEQFRGGTKALKAKRVELKLGKDIFKDARAWKQANLDRYKEILNSRVGTRGQVDAMTAKIVKIANKAIEEGMTLTRVGKWDDLVTSINGNDVRINSVTSAMSRALRNYAEYIRYENDEAQASVDYGGGKYYITQKKDRAGELKKILNAFEKGDANRIERY
jgi:hypothetical protein